MGLWNDIVEVLGFLKIVKIVVFVVKMFGYVGRIVFGEFVLYLMEIDIFEDVRIKVYIERIINELLVSFWRRVVEEMGILLFYIDLILWLVFGGKWEVMEWLKKVCEKWELVFEFGFF